MKIICGCSPNLFTVVYTLTLERPKPELSFLRPNLISDSIQTLSQYSRNMASLTSAYNKHGITKYVVNFFKEIHTVKQ